MKIEELIDRDLSRRIEEIIKVDQLNEHAVHAELDEYVATDRIKRQYEQILDAIATMPSDPHEGVGVWISGFFGSGKSSFAKNLGYILANREVLGDRAAELMKKHLAGSRGPDLIDNINQRIPTEIVMFDVQTDKSIGGTSRSSISRYMYRALLRTLGYAEDFDIAELEQSLEKDKKLDEFVERFDKRYGKWSKRRKMAQKMNEASAILHEMDPSTYSSPDSWALSQGAKRIEVTPGFLVEKTFELAARRAVDADKKPKALVYILDEVGAYVARSAERIEDLRSVVEHFGTRSANLLKAKQIVGPTWIVVTSQEKLSEVTSALDSKRVDIAKLQDRFKYRIDLEPADIREVATRRVLSKNETGEKELKALYKEYEGRIKEHLRLTGTHRKTGIDERSFVDFYPYPPHLLSLSIDIMSGLRLQGDGPRHLGGSNRTIIKQAYEMLVSDRTRLKDAEVGRLATLDLLFELVEGSISSERRKDIADIDEAFGAGSWESRTARAVVLLEDVRDLPRTDGNLAALLHRDFKEGPCTDKVREALLRLEKAQFVRQADGGYKLQTASEKLWTSERRELDPRQRDQTELIRETLGGIFKDPKLTGYQHKSLKRFTVGLSVSGQKLADGDIPLVISVADDADELERLHSELQAESRQPKHEDEVHWLFGLSPQIGDAVIELHRSQQMVRKYDQLRSQGRINPEQASSLSTEKQEQLRHQGRLRELLGQALEGGTAYFRGTKKDGSELGKGRAEIFRGLFDYATPQLYPKLEMGSAKLRGKEAEELLKAANLNGLPPIFYGGEGGLGLVVTEGQKQVPNASAPVAEEILLYLRRQREIGEKVSGKELEGRFTGLGYGWDRDLVQLVLAVLLRAGAIEVIYQGKRFRNHLDPLCREPFTKVPAFRASTFAPRESIGLKTLTTAVQYLEEMTGDEVDIEEAAIARAFKELAKEALSKVVPLRATAKAHELPVEAPLKELETTLGLILSSASDDCVRMLASEGKSLDKAMHQARQIEQALDEEAIRALRLARQVLARLVPELSISGEVDPAAAGESSTAAELAELLKSPELHTQLERIREITGELDAEYGRIYGAQHAERDAAYEAALTAVRDRSAWKSVPEEMRAPLTQPLASRLCQSLSRAPGALVCEGCRATLSQMRSELAATSTLRDGIVHRMAELLAPEQKVTRLRVAELVRAPIETEEDIENLLESLRERLRSLLDEGKKVVVE